MARSLEEMAISKLRSILYDAYRLGLKQGVSKCSLRGGNLRLGILDGSGFGRFQASCCQIVGPVSLMVDLEPIPKTGKELPASYTLLRRLITVFGRGFVDLILGDGLYINAPFFNLCLHEIKSDVLVKTDDTSLLIIKDAMEIFSNDDLFNIAKVKGVDAHRPVWRYRTSLRMCEYQVMMTDGFTMGGITVPLSVAWVVEENLRTGEQEQFWVVASAEYLTKPLTAEEMRELGHWRWDVENNGFKELNQKLKTKHIYSHDDQAQQAVILILFVVFNLLGLYLLFYLAKLTPFVGMKQTRKFAVFYLRCLLIVLAYFDAG